MFNAENEPNDAKSSRAQTFLFGYIVITIFWLIATIALHNFVPKSFAFMIAAPIAFALSILTLRLREIHDYQGWSRESFTALCSMVTVMLFACMVTSINDLRTEIVKHKPDHVVHTPNTVVLFLGDASRSSGNVSLYNSKSPLICQKRVWNWFNNQQTDTWYVCDGAVK